MGKPVFSLPIIVWSKLSSKMFFSNVYVFQKLLFFVFFIFYFQVVDDELEC